LVAPRVFKAMHEFVIVLALLPVVAFLAVLRRTSGWRRPRLVYVVMSVGLLAANGVAIYGGQLFWDDIKDSKVLARNFYGSVQVYPAADTDFPAFVLSHGVTIHGLQFVAWNLRDQPTTYYSRHSGAG